MLQLNSPSIISANEKSIVGFFDYWQTPAKTELAAYEAVVRGGALDGFIYLAFPWATLIDALKSRSFSLVAKLLGELAHLQKQLSTETDKRIVTVCQHISCLDFLYLFEACGVTNIFWSHKTRDLKTKNEISFHPFPLYPAQTHEASDLDKFKKPPHTRQLLTNFIGAFNPKVYLSDTRARIFEDAGKYSDCLIVKREAWHFDRHVYQDQMKGVSAAQEQLLREEMQRREYLEAIGDSVFTLCPSGSGPNSIRIWEAIQLGSIPIILTLDLDLPGDLRLWEDACIFAEDSENGYINALEHIRTMSNEERQVKQNKVMQLAEYMLPVSYGDTIKNGVRKIAS